MEIYDYIHNKETSYYVPDIMNCKKNSDIEILFIVESPHTEEVENHYPLAGESGKEITKYITNQLVEEPLGKLVHENSNGKGGKLNKNIAIVNISNNPLQKLNENENDVRNLILELEKIRGSKVNKILSDYFNHKIIHYFRDNKSMKIIICGSFAQTYFDEFLETKEYKAIGITKLFDRIHKVPHPSYHQWTYIPKHAEALKKINSIFEGLI